MILIATVYFGEFNWSLETLVMVDHVWLRGGFGGECGAIGKMILWLWRWWCPWFGSNVVLALEQYERWYCGCDNDDVLSLRVMFGNWLGKILCFMWEGWSCISPDVFYVRRVKLCFSYIYEICPCKLIILQIYHWFLICIIRIIFLK